MSKKGSEIATAIRTLAKESGVTVKRTLEDCKINRNFLYDLEKGNSSPSVDKLERIAEYFGVGTSKLIGTEEEEFSRFSELFGRLSPEARNRLLEVMESLIE